MCNFFEQTTMSLRLGELFSKKLQKVPNFTKKHQKSSIWPKLATFSSKPPCVGVWVNISANSCKKCVISRKSMRNRRFFQNLEVFRAKHHVSAFGSTFQQESEKRASFRKKSMKNRRFSQTVDFFRANHHVSSFGSLFQEKVAKSVWFRAKALEIVDLAKMFNFLEQTTMFRRYGQLFSKKLQKVPHSAKRMKNRRFGQNVKPGANHHVSAFGSTFQQKVAKST